MPHNPSPRPTHWTIPTAAALAVLAALGPCEASARQPTLVDEASLDPTVQANPRRIDFGTEAPVGEKLSRQIIVTNPTKKPIQINAVRVNGENNTQEPLSAKANCDTSKPVPRGASCAIEVTWAPDHAGAMQGRVYIEYDPSDQPLTVPLSGIARDSGATGNTPTTIRTGSSGHIPGISSRTTSGPRPPAGVLDPQDNLAALPLPMPQYVHADELRDQLDEHPSPPQSTDTKTPQNPTASQPTQAPADADQSQSGPATAPTVVAIMGSSAIVLWDGHSYPVSDGRTLNHDGRAWSIKVDDDAVLLTSGEVSLRAKRN